MGVDSSLDGEGYTFELSGKKVFVAGHNGMVGSALVHRLASESCSILTASREELDLRQQADVHQWFSDNKPDVVFLAAAKVGGIGANSTYPADFIYDNLMIAINVIHAAHRSGVKRLVFLGSSCIYPKFATQPIKEDELLSGYLEPTNEAYAIAKITGLKIVENYRKQYGLDYISVMPTNLYGAGDTYHLENSHVIPSLLMKFHQAKMTDQPSVVVRGSGNPRREFLSADDCADACVYLAKKYSNDEPINIGVGEDITIGELALIIKETTKYEGNITFDTSKPDGTPRKKLDVTKLRSVGWEAKTSLEDGIKMAYDDYVSRFSVAQTIPLAIKLPSKKAMITGVAGQDGAYLAQYLLNIGYIVIGTYRRTSMDLSRYLWRHDKLGILQHPNIIFKTCDVSDVSSCFNIFQEHPDLCEVYNLAAQSFVKESFTTQASTLDVDGKGPLNLLQAIRQTNKAIRFYQASTSELFGKVQEIPQSETTPFYPRSPYAAAKQYGHSMTINYRESYDMFACCGILFNHESPIRGEEFVSRKIAKAVAQVKKGTQECVELGDLDAKRDWGFSGDYVKAMHLMLQQSTPQEYVIATGKTYTVRYMVEKAFARVGMTIRWEGAKEKEQGVDVATGQVVVKINPKFYRPAEVDLLIGNPSKAAHQLGWEAKVSADQLIDMMVDAEMEQML